MEKKNVNRLNLMGLALLLLFINCNVTMAQGLDKQADTLNARENHIRCDSTRKVKEAIPTGERTAEGDIIYKETDQMPSFPGGNTALLEFMRNNVSYHDDYGCGVHSNVVISFVVGKDGTISNVKVARSVDPGLDKDAVRMVKSMPKWIPGKLNGVNVAVRYNVPVSFYWH